MTFFRDVATSFTREMKPTLADPSWMAFGLVANTVVSSVLMALIFYGVVTPLAWVLRRSGRDLLRLKLLPLADTYWLVRRPPGPPPDTMKNQF